MRTSSLDGTMMLFSLSSPWSRGLLWSTVVTLLASLLVHPLGVRTQSLTLAADPPRKSNGLTDVVQWDNYTLFVHDQRFFL